MLALEGFLTSLCLAVMEGKRTVVPGELSLLLDVAAIHNVLDPFFPCKTLIALRNRKPKK